MSKRTLPARSVKVGLFNYRLEDWNVHDANADNAFGDVNHARKRIRVDTTLGSRQAAATLLHELIHCALRHGSWKLDDGNERTTDIVSLALGMMWRDNPKVFAWIHAKLTAP